jgi:hypothetical protein
MDANFQITPQWAALVTRQLALIVTNQEKMMATEASLQTDLDALKTAVQSYVTTAQATITALQNGTVTQTQLDALDAETQGITALVTPAAPAASTT